MRGYGRVLEVFKCHRSSSEFQNPEQLKWMQLFENPSLWWDNRARKWTNQPDFKHALTGESLWISPSEWLEEKLRLLDDPKPRLSRASYRKNDQLHHSEFKSDVLELLSSLKQTSNSGDLEAGKRLHNEAIQSGHDRNLYVSSALVNMYVKCGSLEDAQGVFSGMQDHNSVSWNSLIMGYSESGHGERALELLQEMKRDGCAPNERTLVAALKACTALAMKEEAKVVQRKLLKVESLKRAGALLSDPSFAKDVFVASALVDLYGKCGSMEQAQEVFNKMPYHNVVSWTSLVLGYAENNEEELALSLFNEMRRRCISPNSLTFVAALKACSSLAGTLKISALEKGMALHSEILNSDSSSDILVSNSLIDMYSNCGSLVDARMVFDRAKFHTVVSWNSLLLGYAENSEEELCLELFRFIPEPNSRSFVAVIKACGGAESLEKGLEIHYQASKQGLESDLFFGNALVDMYCKCGSLLCARRVFEGICCKNASSWNGLLSGYVENGEPELALNLFDRMQREGFQATPGTFAAVVKACSAVAEKGDKEAALERGSAIHRLMQGGGFDSDRFVATSLVDFYSKCGFVREAERIFNKICLSDDVVLWTAMMLGYVENSEPGAALELFHRMKHKDSITFVAALKACSSSAGKEEGSLVGGKLVKLLALEKGMEIHSQAREDGFELNSSVMNTLVETYSRAGSMLDARASFDRMFHKGVGVWNTLLLGYVENREEELAMELFREAQQELSPDHRSFVVALKALSSSNTAPLGTLRALHREVCRLGYDEEELLVTSLIDAYGKAGSARHARVLFESMSLNRDLVVWNSLMGAYSQLGEAERALACFQEMRLEGLKGDSITFVVLLTACSRAGLIEKGKKLFSEMEVRFGVEAGVEHCVCMVDLLGRGNELEVALEMVMRQAPESKVAWTGLLAACRKWNNVRVGEIAFEKLVEIDQRSEAAYVLMANVYSSQVPARL